MLRVKLLDPGARLPVVAHPGEDLGYDVFALEGAVLVPHHTVRVRTGIAVAGARLSGVPGELVGSLALAAAPEHFIGLADGYVGYVEDPARALRGEGEAGRTYYGPGLARALGLLEER